MAYIIVKEKKLENLGMNFIFYLNFFLASHLEKTDLFPTIRGAYKTDLILIYM